MLQAAHSSTALLPSSRVHDFMGQTIDLAGQRFGKLVVVELSHRDNGAWWRCRCDCGGESVVRGAVLRYGSTKSCGCGSRAQARANCDKSRRCNDWVPIELKQKLKHAYSNMLKRCYDPENHRYASYGGRGIRVCEDWLEPVRGRHRFYRWCLANGVQGELQIDRIDVDGDYCPDNCRFVDAITQMNNTTRNRWLTYQGQTKTLAEWARSTGMAYGVLKHRLDRGWDVERIMNQPVRRSPRA
jgi:hypothetical protein